MDENCLTSMVTFIFDVAVVDCFEITPLLCHDLSNYISIPGKCTDTYTYTNLNKSVVQIGNLQLP